MRVRTRLPEDDPYATSKTELQWRRDERALKPHAHGEVMWNNQFCAVTTVYYTYDETQPATQEDLNRWAEERRQQRRSQAKRRREAEQVRIRREEEEKEHRKQQIEKQLENQKEKEEEYRKELAHIRSLLAESGKILCLDLETTGLDPSTDEILQISIIDGTGEILLNAYVRPKYTAEWPEAEAINGISPEQVAGCPTIDEYLPYINDIIKKANYLVGYNLTGFDLFFLTAAGVEIPETVNLYDVMLEFAPIYGEWSDYFGDYRWQRLSVCANYYNFQQSGYFHDALYDSRATLHAFKAMVSESPQSTGLEHHQDEEENPTCGDL